MVQREVGERFAAAPGTRRYGVPSVLAQLACDVKVIRPVSRNVFFPVPNVDSVLVRLLRRQAMRRSPTLRALVAAGLRAPAQGARALASSLRGARDRASDVRAALEAIGKPGRRARRVARARTQWRAAARRGCAGLTGLACLAPGKVNLCLFVGRAARRRPAPARVSSSSRSRSPTS